jgi:hypothetical protein
MSRAFLLVRYNATNEQDLYIQRDIQVYTRKRRKYKRRLEKVEKENGQGVERVRRE